MDSAFMEFMETLLWSSGRSSGGRNWRGVARARLGRGTSREFFAVEHEIN